MASISNQAQIIGGHVLHGYHHEAINDGVQVWVNTLHVDVQVILPFSPSLLS
jgi:hypothetical protein